MACSPQCDVFASHSSCVVLPLLTRRSCIDRYAGRRGFADTEPLPDRDVVEPRCVATEVSRDVALVPAPISGLGCGSPSRPDTRSPSATRPPRNMTPAQQTKPERVVAGQVLQVPHQVRSGEAAEIAHRVDEGDGSGRGSTGQKSRRQAPEGSDRAPASGNRQREPDRERCPVGWAGSPGPGQRPPRRRPRRSASGARPCDPSSVRGAP